MTAFELDTKELNSQSITINNIVAKLDIGIELDLQYLSSELSNSSFEPQRYPSLIFRPDGLSTVLITGTGIILFTGCDSIDSLQKTYDQVCKELNVIGIDDVKDLESIQIVNVVCTFDLNTNIDLNRLCLNLGFESVEYEPEQFPGLVYRIEEDGPVILVFSTGKIVVTGAITTKEIQNAKSRIQKLLPK